MPGFHCGWVLLGVSVVCPVLAPGGLAVEGFCGVPHPWGHHCVFVGCSGGLRWGVVACLVFVSSSAVPLCGLLWRCVGGGLGLGGSWEAAGTAGSGWLGGGVHVCVGLHCDLRCFFSGCGVPGVSALCCLRGFLLCPFPAPLFLLVCLIVPIDVFFLVFSGGACVVRVRRLRCWAWAWVRAGAGVGGGVDAVEDDGWPAVALRVPCVCVGPRSSGDFRFPGRLSEGACGGRSAAGWHGRTRAYMWVCSSRRPFG